MMPPAPPPDRPPAEPPGVPAIAPRTVPSRPDEAAFTAQDVIDHIRDHPVAGVGRVRSSTPIAVEGVEFLTARAVGARLNRGMNLPDDLPVCFVTLRGDFALHSRGATFTSPRAFRLYDARTGNFLALGMLD